MAKTFLLCFLILSLSKSYSQNGKPDYVGHISYTKGNFGSYNYPVIDDSVLVYIDGSNISIVLFPKNQPELKRNMELDTKNLVLDKKIEYQNIVTPNKKINTGNYDMKFSSKNTNSLSQQKVYLTHYGDGTWAELVCTVEHDGLRLDDLFVATLVKK